MGAIVSFPCGPKVGTKGAGHGAIDISHIENKPSFFLALNVLIKRQDLFPSPYVWGRTLCLVHHFPSQGVRWPENTAGLSGTRLFFFKPFPWWSSLKRLFVFLLVLVSFLLFVLVFKRLLTNGQDNDATLYSSFTGQETTSCGVDHTRDPHQASTISKTDIHDVENT